MIDEDFATHGLLWMYYHQEADSEDVLNKDKGKDVATIPVGLGGA